MFDLSPEEMFGRMEERVPLLTKVKHAIRKATTDTGRVKEVERVTRDGKWRELAEQRSTGKRALFVAPRFWPIHTGWELTFGWLAARAGYSPSFINCSAITPICDAQRIEHKLGLFCQRCQDSTRRMVEAAKMPWCDMTDFVDKQRVQQQAMATVAGMTLDDILAYEVDGLPIGKWIKEPVIRYLRGDISDDQQTLDAARLFLAGALAVREAADKVLDQSWDLIFMLCGRFLHERIFYELARRRGIDVFVYERGYLPDTLVMHVNELCDFEVKDDWSWMADTELTDGQLDEIDRYFAARRNGDTGIFDFWPKLEEDVERIKDELDLRDGRPVTLLCSNIAWDLGVIGREIGFTSLIDWVRCCVESLQRRPDEVLIVRVHPAEVTLKGQRTLDRLQDMIEKEFPNLTENIRVVPAESDISTYILMEMAERVLVYTSTVGLESARMGKQVFVSGRTSYRGKGFTVDIDSPGQLKRLLDEPARDLTSAEIELCRKYAWHFFYNLQIPYPLLHEYSPGSFRYTFDRVEDLFRDDNAFANYFCTELQRRPHRFLVRR